MPTRHKKKSFGLDDLSFDQGFGVTSTLGFGTGFGVVAPSLGAVTPPAASYYLRPDGVSRYNRPDGTSFYLRP